MVVAGAQLEAVQGGSTRRFTERPTEDDEDKWFLRQATAEQVERLLVRLEMDVAVELHMVARWPSRWWIDHIGVYEMEIIEHPSIRW